MTTSPPQKETCQIAVLILAGGQGRRMGGCDKPLLSLGGRPLLSHILERLPKGLTLIGLNVNGPGLEYQDFVLPLVSDTVPGRPGPLAGVLAGLEWAAGTRKGITHLLTLPGDCPFIPKDLAPRLCEAYASLTASANPFPTVKRFPVACARSGGRTHPVIALWPLTMRTQLREALTGQNMRRVMGWLDQCHVASAEWPIEPVDPFFNINTPEDLAQAEALISQARIAQE